MRERRASMLLLAGAFGVVFLATGWYLSGVFVQPPWGVLPAGPEPPRPDVDWARVLTAAGTLGVLATALVGALHRLVRR